MIRRLSVGVLLAVLLLSVFIAPQQRASAATTAAPAPTLIAEVLGGGKGRVWAGAVPAYSDTKPVLVFVHGLHGKARDWWSETTYHGVNDMYDKAFASGYRTAFVSMNDEAGGPAYTMWANGSTLNRQIDVILAHYRVSSVNVIAHSKGGIDINAAVVHYGAASKVQKVVTLATPHHGSEVANLAYSWWSGWVATLLGSKDDGTYSLQTSYMSNFRAQTDGSSAYTVSRMYTATGYHGGPTWSALWYGSKYLEGENDGLVRVVSSSNPRQYARLFKDSTLDHDKVRKGSSVWTRIEPIVRTNWRTASTPTSVGAETQAAAPINEVTASSSILRGGLIDGGRGRITLPVEGGVEQISFDLLSDKTGLGVTFIDPQGGRHVAGAPTVDDGLFRGGFHYNVQVDAPLSGVWSVELSGPQGAGYLLNAQLQSSLNVTMTRDQVLVAPGSPLKLNVAATGKAPVTSLQVNGLMSGTATGRELPSSLPTQVNLAASGKAQALAQVTAPRAVGLYQLGVTVTGVAADGTTFERSFASNFPVVVPGSKATTLPAGR